MGEQINQEFEEYQKLLQKQEMRLKQVVKFDTECKEMIELENLIKEDKTYETNR